MCRAADSRLSGAGGGNLQHAHGGVSLSPYQTMPSKPSACPHPGEFEIRVVGITDDVYTISAERDDFTIHNDMTDGDVRFRVTCSCGKTWEAPGHAWEYARLPKWVKNVLEWFEQNRFIARDRDRQRIDAQDSELGREMREVLRNLP